MGALNPSVFTHAVLKGLHAEEMGGLLGAQFVQIEVRGFWVHALHALLSLRALHTSYALRSSYALAAWHVMTLSGLLGSQPVPTGACVYITR